MSAFFFFFVLGVEVRFLLVGVERFFCVIEEKNKGCKLALAPLDCLCCYAMMLPQIISLVRVQASWCIGRKLLWVPNIGWGQGKQRQFVQPMLRVEQRKL